MPFSNVVQLRQRIRKNCPEGRVKSCLEAWTGELDTESRMSLIKRHFFPRWWRVLQQLPSAQNCYVQRIVLILVHGSTNEEELYLDLMLRWSQNPGSRIWCCEGIHHLMFSLGMGRVYYYMKEWDEYLWPREQTVVNFTIIFHSSLSFPILCHVSCCVPPWNIPSYW